MRNWSFAIVAGKEDFSISLPVPADMSMEGRRVYVVIDIDSNDIQGIYSSRVKAEYNMADDSDDIEEWVVK